MSLSTSNWSKVQHLIRQTTYGGDVPKKSNTSAKETDACWECLVCKYLGRIIDKADANLRRAREDAAHAQNAAIPAFNSMTLPDTAYEKCTTKIGNNPCSLQNHFARAHMMCGEPPATTFFVAPVATFHAKFPFVANPRRANDAPNPAVGGALGADAKKKELNFFSFHRHETFKFFNNVKKQVFFIKEIIKKSK
jgi:hypothetical protein